MVLCPKCGRENNDQARLCYRCYTSLKPVSRIAKPFRPRRTLRLLRYFLDLFESVRGASRDDLEVKRFFKAELREGREEFPEVSVAPGGTWIAIGGLSYMISRVEWSERLTGERAMDRKPDATFLIIHVTVRNDDREPRTIPFFGLVDEEGAEFEVWDKGWFIENRLGRFERINPGVAKSGTVVFDVPKLPRYHLRIPKGLWSKEYALIRLED